MDKELVEYYKAIGRVSAINKEASTLEEALRSGVRTIAHSAGATFAVIWYLDRDGDGLLHPLFWVGPFDITGCSHRPGEGSVGQVFQTQIADRRLDFCADPDPQTVADFEGVEVNSMICAPLSNKYEDIGVVQFLNRDDGSLYTDQWADVIEIMSMVTPAVFYDRQEESLPWSLGDTVMRLRDVTREYTNGEVVTRVLKGVNLNVYEGEFLVLLGESGCGKSTLLNIVAGMDKATSGVVECLGEDLSDATQEELTLFRRKNIGFIFQSYNLIPVLTSHYNLTLISELVDDSMDADEALELVGLAERKDNLPSQMSGGQQQRVSIARALVKKPKIILADEPTAALDYATSIEILQVMEKVMEGGATMVMVTHNEEIARMANRVVRVRDGRMHEVAVNLHPARATDLVW